MWPVILFTLLGLVAWANAFAVTFQTESDFIAMAFKDTKPDQRVIWLTQAHQDAAEDILGHAYPALRLRYWQSGNRTVWVLEEIGKERPITMGFIVQDSAIVSAHILTYRELRGGEVRHPFFLDQFRGMELDSNMKLSQHIDGISGATLSVRAVTVVSKFVLYLDKFVKQKSAG